MAWQGGLVDLEFDHEGGADPKSLDAKKAE
jgi:hypothetical protein